MGVDEVFQGILSEKDILRYVNLCHAVWSTIHKSPLPKDGGQRAAIHDRIVYLVAKPIAEIYCIHFPFDRVFYRNVRDNWQHFHSSEWVAAFIQNFLSFMDAANALALKEIGIEMWDSQIQYSNPGAAL